MIPGFYKLSVAARREKLMRGDFGHDDVETLFGPLCDETACLDRMSENVAGALRLPMGVVTGIVVDGVEHVVPMATEEPSVVAAVNRVARLLNAAGGVTTSVETPVTYAQVMVVVAPESAQLLTQRIVSDRERWLDVANRCDPKLVSLGGGAFDLDVDVLAATSDWDETFVVSRLHVHTCDAMGANAVNTMAEAVMREMVAFYAADFDSIEPGMAILTNASPGRMVTANARIPFDVASQICGMDGARFAQLVSRGSAFAARSPERAITHNKGILNGVVAAALAFGQDTRALSIAAADEACRTGHHRPLATWRMAHDALCGSLSMPIVAGFVGGVRCCPQYQAAYRLAGIERYQTLCGVLAAIGLAQNLGALWALVTEGIQAGHMKLHKRKE